MDAPIQERETWSRKLDFVLTCIGWCVGLGNVWRYPYLCYKNGGGVFLIPYVITLILCALPMISLEFFIGQYSGLSALPVFNICPLFKGVGYVVLILNAIFAIHYIVLLAIAIRYLAASFTSTLPWSTCENSWNTQSCRVMQVSVSSDTQAGYNVSNTLKNETNHTLPGTAINLTNQLSTGHISSAEEYFWNNVVNISDGIDNIGSISLSLLVCFIIAWLLVTLANIKGIKSAGKVVYFTATFPYVMLTILVIRGCTLQGSMKGITFYLYPDWSKLLQSQVWYSAATQVCYSTGTGQGNLLTLASYHKFKTKNTMRDAVITGIVNCCTSFYAGFAVFSVLGYMAHQTNTHISKVVTSGPGLAFIAYPQALATMPLAPFWSASFFFMILLLGIDSELVHVESVISCLRDEFPALRGAKRRYLLSAVVVLLFFTAGLIFLTQGGFYVFTLVDWYGATFSIIIIAIMQSFVFIWVYGRKNLYECYKTMFGHSPSWYFKICWSIVSPCFILLILVMSIIYWKPVTLDTYEYPIAARVAGWSLAGLSLLPIPVLFVYSVVKSEAPSFAEKLRKAARPSHGYLQHIKRRILQDSNQDPSSLERLHDQKQLMTLS